jgi:SagB-type dehydrogenase family enzyme
MPLDAHLGRLAEEYHVASRNQSAFKNNHRAHQVHYEPHIQELVRGAPLRLDAAERFVLPRPSPVSMSLEEAILSRSSGRRFAPRPLAAADLAALLHLANGMRPSAQGEPRRNAPSSGNLGSVEIFPIVLDVAGIDPGIYHFDTVAHELAQLTPGSFRAWLRERVFYQLEFAEAAVALVLTSAIGRLAVKYGQRAYRLSMLDVGHVSENIYLVGTALGLEACATAGFIDDELDAALGLDGVDAASMLVLLIGSA